MKDIARLRFNNIDGNSITFIRSKTERSTRYYQKPVVAHLTDKAQEIIEKWGNKPKDPENYIFPILLEGLSPREELMKVRQFTKTMNKYLKRIASKLGIEKNLTTYSARHSFSTVLKRSGASIEFISESLGHKDIRTTESYLDSFEDDKRKEFAEKLTDF